MSETIALKSTINKSVVKQYTVLAMVIGIGIFLRYKYMAGSFVGGDELYYIRRIVEILQGELNTTTFQWYDYRIMIYLPQALINSVLGFSPLSIVLWPFMASTLHIIIVYKISTLLFNDFRTALFSAIIFCFSPLNVVEIRLMPDAIFSFFLTLTVYFFIKSSNASKPRNRLYHTILSSICLISSFFVRENAFLIIPLLAIFIIIDKKNRSFYLKFSVALIVSALIFFSVLAAADILNVFSRMADLWDYFISDHVFRGVGQIIYLPFFNYLFHPNINGYWITIIVFTGISFLAYLRDKQSLFPIVWFMSIYLYFEFISPLHALRPAEGSFRYFMPFVAPSAIVAGRFLDRWIVISQAEVRNTQTILITISLFLFVFLQNTINNYIAMLVPIALYFILLLSNNRPNKNEYIEHALCLSEIRILKYLSPIFLSVSILISLSYITVANYGYDKITHNKLASSIYRNLLNKKTGLIASNEYLLERKLNLFLTAKLHDRSEFHDYHYDYIVTLNNDLLRTSYQTYRNEPEYNAALYSALHPDKYILRESTPNYNIYSVK